MEANEEADDVLQRIGDVDTGILLDEGGDGKEDQGEDAQEGVLVVADEDLYRHDQEDDGAQRVVDEGRAIARSEDLFQFLLGGTFEPFHEPIVVGVLPKVK